MFYSEHFSFVLHLIVLVIRSGISDQIHFGFAKIIKKIPEFLKFRDICHSSDAWLLLNI